VLAARSPGADCVTFTSERPPAAVVVDPDRVLLDRSPQQDRAAVRRVGVRWVPLGRLTIPPAMPAAE
jgi:hypothetical protein